MFCLKKRVFNQQVQQYRLGSTPFPAHLKFGTFNVFNKTTKIENARDIKLS